MKIRGNAKRRIRDIHQPRMNAKDKPEMHIAIARRIWPIFSPRAFTIVADSLVSLAGNSVALFSSNQEISCYSTALR
jgi:hypothetical protein